VSDKTRQAFERVGAALKQQRADLESAIEDLNDVPPEADEEGDE
jgi:hypothetical protein